MLQKCCCQKCFYQNLSKHVTINIISWAYIALKIQSYSETVMMLQEITITGQGVHKITSSNSTELFLYNSCHQSKSFGGTGFLVTTKAEITFKPISERISILTTTMKKRKYCFISVYAPRNESTVKDPEKMRTFYEQLSDIISTINRDVLIITIGGDFNAKTKMRSRDPLLNKIIGKYTKNDINENG